MIDRKINILFLIPSLRIGGAERQVVDLVNGISKERFNIHLFTFERELDLVGSLRKETIRFSNCPRRHKWDFSPTNKIAQIIDEERIDLVHCTLEIAILFGFLGRLKARRKTKFVGAIHTTINRNFKNELFDWFFYAPLMSFCHVVITVCQNQRIHWSRKYPFLANKFVTIYNGIDGDKFRDSFSREEKVKIREALKIRDDEFAAAIVASLGRKKGHEYAFQAVKALGRRGEKVKLLLLGDGERKIFLRRFAERLSVTKNLIWLGYQSDPRAFLSISDVLLVPSIAESLPMAILEALAMGKPVIASRIGGIPEVIKEGLNGFLFKPKDVFSLAEKLHILIKDEALRKGLSKEAREFVISRFSASEMVRKTETLFARLYDRG